MPLIKISQIGDVPYAGLMGQVRHRVCFLGDREPDRRWGDSRDCTHHAPTME